MPSPALLASPIFADELNAALRPHSDVRSRSEKRTLTFAHAERYDRTTPSWHNSGQRPDW
jgi:hypothetical protein